jgi:ferredoxin-type protein NapG
VNETSHRQGDRDGLHSLLSRRAFVAFVGKGTMAVVLGGLLRFSPQAPIVRPPGALPEEEFLSLCIKCDKCREVCPQGVITPVLLTESVIGVGTPRLRWPCTHCMRCNTVCPTHALRW